MNYAQAFAALSTPCVSDALDKLGINGGCEGLRPVAPGLRCVGPAFTLSFEAVPAGTSAPAADYIDEVPSGSVIAIDNGGRTYCTVWGDILTLCALRMGLAGTVIHGCCRDTASIIGTGYPLFSISSYMKSGKNRVRLAARQIPVQLGSTQVAAGDILLCDDSGVLAIPAARVDEVLGVARAIEAMESRVVEAVKRGTPLKVARELNNYNSFAFRAAQ